MSNVNDLRAISNETTTLKKSIDVDKILDSFEQPPTEIIGILLASGSITPVRAGMILRKIPDVHVELEDMKPYRESERSRFRSKKVEYLTESQIAALLTITSNSSEALSPIVTLRLLKYILTNFKTASPKTVSFLLKSAMVEVNTFTFHEVNLALESLDLLNRNLYYNSNPELANILKVFDQALTFTLTTLIQESAIEGVLSYDIDSVFINELSPKALIRFMRQMQYQPESLRLVFQRFYNSVQAMKFRLLELKKKHAIAADLYLNSSILTLEEAVSVINFFGDYLTNTAPKSLQVAYKNQIKPIDPKNYEFVPTDFLGKYLSESLMLNSMIFLLKLSVLTIKHTDQVNHELFNKREKLLKDQEFIKKWHALRLDNYTNFCRIENSFKSRFSSMSNHAMGLKLKGGAMKRKDEASEQFEYIEKLKKVLIEKGLDCRLEALKIDDEKMKDDSFYRIGQMNLLTDAVKKANRKEFSRKLKI